MVSRIRRQFSERRITNCQHRPFTASAVPDTSIDVLSDPNSSWELKNSACQQLASAFLRGESLTEPDVLIRLTPLLDAAQWQLRDSAAFTLYIIAAEGTPQAPEVSLVVHALETLLEDPTWQVRMHVAHAWGQLAQKGMLASDTISYMTTVLHKMALREREKRVRIQLTSSLVFLYMTPQLESVRPSVEWSHLIEPALVALYDDDEVSIQLGADAIQKMLACGAPLPEDPNTPANPIVIQNHDHDHNHTVTLSLTTPINMPRTTAPNCWSG